MGERIAEQPRCPKCGFRHWPENPCPFTYGSTEQYRSYGEQWMKDLRAELTRRENKPCGLGRDWDAIKQLLLRLDSKQEYSYEQCSGRRVSAGEYLCADGNWKPCYLLADGDMDDGYVSIEANGVEHRVPQSGFRRLPEQSEAEARRIALEIRELFGKRLDAHSGLPEWEDLVPIINTALSSLRRQLERERMCHAACGVIAMSNTPESLAKNRKMLPEYLSASVQDVIRAVERELSVQRENADVKAERDALSIDLEKVQIKNDSYYQRLNMAEAALRKAQYWIKTPTFGEQRARDTNPDRRKEWSELVSEIDAALATATEIKA